MRRLADPVLWIAAVAVAAVVVWRIRRRRRVVLMGTLGPRLLRMVVVVLVFFGVGCERKPASRTAAAPPVPAQPGAPADAATEAEADVASDAPVAEPPALAPAATSPIPDEARLRAWIARQERHSAWSAYKLAATRAQLQGAAMPPGAYTKALAAATSAQTALAALDELEADGIYDHWLAAYLWRATSSAVDARPLAALYERLTVHARVTDALVAAYAQVGPVAAAPSAWRSKAAPPPSVRQAGAQALRDLAAAAAARYPTTEPGTWRRDGVVELVLAGGATAPDLVSGGTGKRLVRGAPFRFGRLDLLVTGIAPVVLEHARFGRVSLSGNTAYSVWDLPDTLAVAGRARARDVIAAALGGDEAAALDVERALPLLHRDLRAALAASPHAKGAARLRTIMALFDDVPMPAPAAAPAPAPAAP